MTTVKITALDLDTEHPSRLAQTRIRIQIPRQYQQDPIISQLATRYRLEINILAAILGANGKDSGWFDLHLVGTDQDIQDALVYLGDLNINILSDLETDGW
jgi:ABC-type methionine transport system ATPase subunit